MHLLFVFLLVSSHLAYSMKGTDRTTQPSLERQTSSVPLERSQTIGSSDTPVTTPSSKTLRRKKTLTKASDDTNTDHHSFGKNSRKILSFKRSTSNKVAHSDEDLKVVPVLLSERNSWFNFNSDVRTASVTPYRMVQPPPEEIKEIKIPGYKIERLVFIGRHGIRLPTEETIIEMKSRLPKLQKMIVDAAARNPNEPNKCYSEGMKNWEMYEELAVENVERKLLVKSGQIESFKMGQRFRVFFKNILPEKLDDSIVVKFTDCPRTQETAFELLKGAFEKLPEGDDWYEEVVASDSILKYDSSCTMWKTFKKSDLNLHSLLSFLCGNEMQNTAVEVGQRCQLKEKVFSIDDLILVYEMCCFEVAWIGESPWCSLLTLEHKKVLEYSADFELYINAGYANEMNKRIPCVLFNDVMDNLLIKTERKATIYITHLMSVLKFLAFLGLYRDDKINISSFTYGKEVEDRIWRSSYIGAFGTNITVVLFQNENTGERAIQVRHQERPVHIPGCNPDKYFLCPLEDFVLVFKDLIGDKCLFKEWCKSRKLFDSKNEGHILQKFNTSQHGVRRRLTKIKTKKEQKNEGKEHTKKIREQRTFEADQAFMQSTKGEPSSDKGRRKKKIKDEQLVEAEQSMEEIVEIPSAKGGDLAKETRKELTAHGETMLKVGEGAEDTEKASAQKSDELTEEEGSSERAESEESDENSELLRRNFSRVRKFTNEYVSGG